MNPKKQLHVNEHLIRERVKQYDITGDSPFAYQATAFLLQELDKLRRPVTGPCDTCGCRMVH
jgi:hypothetical protein